MRLYWGIGLTYDEEIKKIDLTDYAYGLGLEYRFANRLSLYLDASVDRSDMQMDGLRQMSDMYKITPGVRLYVNRNSNFYLLANTTVGYVHVGYSENTLTNHEYYWFNMWSIGAGWKFFFGKKKRWGVDVAAKKNVQLWGNMSAVTNANMRNGGVLEVSFFFKF